MARLSVNLNKIAVLRNSRGGTLPSILRAAEVVVAAGARGLTVHPRPDLRHVRPDDVLNLAEWLARHNDAVAEGARVELNIEGNPFAPARGNGYPGLLELVRKARPDQVTFVPDADGQITSDHGFDLATPPQRLQALIRDGAGLGARVSLFVDADSDSIQRAADLGAQRIEIYTGPFASGVQAGASVAVIEQCRRAAAQARSAGLAINAGHDLDLLNLPLLLAAIPDIAEVSIGHALINDALYLGLDSAVRAYLEACEPT
jgi:pyridoxine 5-phosphate synthase